MDAVSDFLNHMDWGSLLALLLRVAAVLICIVIHEVCHGLAAYLLGDPTARAMHRLTLNPIRHIDPLGALMMLVAGFGWAKPVPVDMRRFKRPKLGMAVTALAGPVSNFLLAYLAYLAAYTVLGVAVNQPSAGRGAQEIIDFCTMLAALSIGLGIFNLIPFPPLDGSKVLGAFLPGRFYHTVLRYEHFGMIALMALLWFGVLDGILGTALYCVSELLLSWASWPMMLLT